MQHPSHVVRDLHLVLHRPRVHLHELGVIDVDAQFAGQDPVDREDLLEPADVLPVPALVRRVVRGREPDRDAADVLAADRREHVVGEPTESLLVGADDPDARLGGAGLPERRLELLLEPHPEVRRLAHQDLDLHAVSRAHPRHYVGGEPLAQFVHLPAEVEFLVEDGDRPVARSRGDRDLRHPRLLPQPRLQEGSHFRARLLEEYVHLQRSDVAAGPRVAQVVEVDERPRGLTGARSRTQEGARVLLDGGEVHFATAGLPERGKPSGQVGGRGVEPGRVTAPHPHRRGVPEGARDDLHDALAGVESPAGRQRRREIPRADQHRIREHRGILDVPLHEGDREGQARRLKPDAGREVHRSEHRTRPGADDEHGFRLVRDHVVAARVAEEPVGRVEPGQVQRRGLRLPGVFREAALVGGPEAVHHHPVPVRKLEVEGACPVVVEPHRPAVGEPRLSHPVVGGELVEHLGGVPRIHHVERHDEAGHLLPAVFVDGFGGPDPVHVHAALAEELLDVVHHRRDRVAPELPEVGKPGRRGVRRVERSRRVGAGDHHGVRAPEGSRDDGEEPLPRGQSREADAPVFLQLPDPAVRAADEEEGRSVGSRFDGRVEHRQTGREGRRLEAQPGRDVRGGGHLLGHRIGRQHDPGIDEVHHAVAVPVLEEDAGGKDVFEASKRDTRPGVLLGLPGGRRVEQGEGRKRPRDPRAALRTHDVLPYSRSDSTTPRSSSSSPVSTGSRSSNRSKAESVGCESAPST